MVDKVREVLEEAIRTGEVVPIVYHGGSQPGSIREISPISVSSSSVQARDLATGIPKTFRLAKIELAASGLEAATYEAPSLPVVEEGATVREAFQNRTIALGALGWHVELSSESVSLHRYFKNGKPRKTPDISLSYQPTQEYEEWTEVGEYEIRARASTRPWRLESRMNPRARSFAKLSGAVVAFMELVNRISVD